MFIIPLSHSLCGCHLFGKKLTGPGWRGLGEGFLKGVRGAVAQPVSGLMHGAQHIEAWSMLSVHMIQLCTCADATEVVDHDVMLRCKVLKHSSSSHEMIDFHFFDATKKCMKRYNNHMIEQKL